MSLAHKKKSPRSNCSFSVAVAPSMAQPAAGVARFLALLELLEVHRVVHIGDEDAIRVRDERSSDEHPALEHEDVAPLHELAELRRSPGAHPESLAWSIGGDGAHQLDVVLAGQRLRHLP